MARAEFALMWNRQERAKAERLDQLKVILKNATCPISEELFDELQGLFITKFIEVMRSHPGYVTEDKIRSLRTSIVLLERTAVDLTSALDNFDVFSHSEKFHSRTGRAQHSELESRIRKELYCFASLAHAIEDQFFACGGPQSPLRSFPRTREPTFCGKVWIPASAGTSGN